MRPGIFVVAAALALAAVAGQNTLLDPSHETPPPAVAACAEESAAALAGGCLDPAAGGVPATVLAHTVFTGACAAGADLHVMRFVPAGDAPDTPVVATWCT